MLLQQRYWQRACHEWQVLTRKGFADYMLAIIDVVNWMKKQDALVMLRGSAAGCLILWLTGASEVDPILHDLSFERFYDDNRPDPPDVDIDFEQSRRNEAIQYIYSTYGQDCCSQIAALSALKAKAALVDACAAFGIPRNVYGPLATALDSADADVAHQLDTVTDPAAMKVLEQHPELREVVPLMIGQYRQASIHAAGVIISSEPLDHVIGVMLGADKQAVAAIDKRGAAELGLLKMDFLAVKSLDVIAETARRVWGSVQPLYKLPLEDPKALALANDRQLAGVFQLDGQAAARVAARIGIHSFEDLVAASALCRPGPADWVTTYRTNKEDWHNFATYVGKYHPIAQLIIKKTFGILIFQEQVMALARELAGFDWPKVHQLRKGVADKLGLDPQKGPAWEAEWSKLFIEGCFWQGVSPTEAKHWWDSIKTHGGYSFNRCLTGDTLVYRGAAGRYGGNEITLTELYAAQEGNTAWSKKIRAGKLTLLQMDADGRVRPRHLKRVYQNGVCEVWRVNTTSGRHIDATANHRLLTQRGYVEVSQLTLDDSLTIMEEREQRPKTGPRSAATGNNYTGKGFQNGNSNPSYIDGRTALLHQLRLELKQRSKGECELCHAIDSSRFECAHMNSLEQCGGDYSRYHSLGNALWLCNSCHKQLDHDKGERVKRWGKGRPTAHDRIISIESIGQQVVYDVEMATEGHNFIANEIVSHNSHCVSYGVIGAWMLYLKAHHPAEFYATYLELEDDDVKRGRLAREYLALHPDNRVHLLDQYVPSVTFRKWDEHTIVGGLSQLRNVGTKTAERTVNTLQQLAEGGFSPMNEDDAWAALYSALPDRVTDAIEQAGVRTREWRVDALIELAPWFPVPRLEPEHEAIRANGSLRRLCELPSMTSQSEVVVCGYVKVTDFDHERIGAVIEDETAAIHVRVSARNAKSKGPAFKQYRPGDFIMVRGFWSNDVLYADQFGPQDDDQEKVLTNERSRRIAARPNPLNIGDRQQPKNRVKRQRTARPKGDAASFLPPLPQPVESGGAGGNEASR